MSWLHNIADAARRALNRFADAAADAAPVKPPLVTPPPQDVDDPAEADVVDEPEPDDGELPAAAPGSLIPPVADASPHRSGPLFVADMSHWNGPVNWDQFFTDRRYIGAWIKATQGTSYPYVNYFRAQINAAITAGLQCGRLGEDAWLGGYVYLAFDQNGARQAEYAHRVMTPLMRLRRGRLRMLLDIERGSEGSANYDDLAPEIIACAHAFVTRWMELTGEVPVLYGRGAMQDRKIRGLLGCRGLVNPAYTRRLPPTDRIGISRRETVGWQYSNGQTNRTPFPTHPPGVVRCDSTVLLAPEPGRLADLDDARRLLVAV